MIRINSVLSALLVCLTTLFLLSCDAGATINGSGTIISETRAPGAFAGLEINVPAKVTIHYDTAASLKLTGDDNILPILRATINGDILRIESDDQIDPSQELEIEVWIPRLRSVAINGSADVDVDGKPIDAATLDNFSLSIDGSGTINAQKINAEQGNVSIEGEGTITLKEMVLKELDARISGSGTIIISGTEKIAEKVTATIDGSGRIDLRDLRADNGTGTISGSGELWFNVLETLRVTIDGSGTVYHVGDPSSLQTSINGSGKVIKK